MNNPRITAKWKIHLTQDEEKLMTPASRISQWFRRCLSHLPVIALGSGPNGPSEGIWLDSYYSGEFGQDAVWYYEKLRQFGRDQPHATELP